MAKKKKVTKKKVARSAKKKPAKRAASDKSNDSVDSLLKKFSQARSSKEAELENVKTKIADLRDKVVKYQEQIEKLTEQQQLVQTTISELDGRRDQEVSTLLARLGVQLSTPATSPAATTSNEDSEEMPTLRLGGAG